MAIKKFKIEASEQAKQLAKKPVKASDGEWDKAVISFIDTIPELPEQGKVISKTYKGWPIVIVGLGNGKCLYHSYLQKANAASDIQFIRGLIKRGDAPEKAVENLGFKTYTRSDVEGACGGKKKPVKSAAGKKRWGLYSDFGQRILNETFDSKREAQKAFREYGYTKDSEAWIEEVDETAVGKFDKKSANSACGGKKSVKSSMSDDGDTGITFTDDDGAILRVVKRPYGYRIRRIKEFADGTDYDISKEIYDTAEEAKQAALEGKATYSLKGRKSHTPPPVKSSIKNKSIKSSAKKSVKCAADNADLERAKQNIVDDFNNENDKDYTVDEYFADEDLNRVPILYTTIGDTDEHEYQLYADLINPKIIVEIDGKTIYEDKFPSIGALADDLEDFDWDNWYSYYLRYVPDEIVFGEEVNGACGGKKSVKSAARKPARKTVRASDDPNSDDFFDDLPDNGEPVDPKDINRLRSKLAEKKKFIQNLDLSVDTINQCMREYSDWLAENYPNDFDLYYDKSMMDKYLDVLSFASEEQLDAMDKGKFSNYVNMIRKSKDYFPDVKASCRNKKVKASKQSRSVKAASADGYKFAFYRDGYRVLRKTENNRGKWLAQKDDEEPFEITYEQARGFEPIDPRNRALQMKLGKALKLPIRSSAVKAAKKDDMNKEAHKWYNISLTKDEYAKFRKFLKENGYKYEPSEEGQNTYVKVYLTKADADKVNKFLDSMDDVESACGGKKLKKTVKASAAAKRRAKQKVTASMPDLEDIVMYFDHKKIYEGDGSGLTAAVEELCKDDEIKAKFVEWCNQFGDPIAFESGDAHDTAFAFAWLVDTIRYEELDKFYIDGDGILDFEIFNKSDEVTGATKPVTCSEDGPLCVCDSCLAGIESAEQPVKASKYYEITDHNNNEVGRSDLEDEARELAKKLLKENDEDHYDIWWVDTDPDSTDDTSYIDTVYADKPFSVEGYLETNFRGLSDSDTFYELRDALDYAQELLGNGLSVRMECENAGGRLEITPDEYDEFVQTSDGALFEDMSEVAEWLHQVQVERMDSHQEPWLDNWQYNTDIGMSTNVGRKSVKADFNDIEDIEDFYDGENFDDTKALGAFNSDTAPYDVNTTVAEYITDNYGIYAESVSYVEYNGPGDWVVDMSQSGQAVADDFVYFLSEKDYDLSLKLYGESETDASGYDMAKYYGDSAIHGNDFQFQFYPAQNQWSAPQVDVDINELIQIGLTQEEANRVVDLVAEYEQNYISICQDINYYIESFLKELSEEEVKASTGVKAALDNKDKTDYASNPIYELDKYVKDLAEGVAAAAGITLTYQVSDEAITFIDGDGTAVFIQPISEITPEPDDLENDIQELVSAIQYEDSDNPEYWPIDTTEDDPDYATRAVQMSVDDELEPVMGEGEDIGYGIDSYGETIDESTVNELYRMAERDILPKTELAQIDPYVSIDEDSWDFYFGGVSNAGMMGVVKFYIHFKLTSDNIDLNEYVLPDAKLYPDFNYYKASLDFDIYTENGKVTDVVLESADIYKSDNSYDDHFSDKFGETFNTEALENYIEKLAAPAAEEIYNAVSNL